ncbi:MAG: hypothetical protein EBX40_06670, partial [Gammaproteobacteria bacterium]|nr:hypothetical protein [Gammaproteobacteria bacterium]
DMLYLPPGTGHPIRIHGAYVADHEVQAVVEAWKAQGQPEYLEDILEGSADEESRGDEEGNGERDDLYDEAVSIVLETQRASISAVQRRLRIGYNRAARLLEQMEAEGIVTEILPNGLREVIQKS